MGIKVPLNNDFRKPSNVLDKPKKVHFNSGAHQQMINELTKKKKKKMVAKDIDNNWKEAKIYFNEQMPATVRQFFFQNNTIYVKKIKW